MKSRNETKHTGTNVITLVFGRKRTRKTRYQLRYMRKHPRVIYIDPKGKEYDFGVECRNVEAVRDLTERGGNFRVRVPVNDAEWASRICQQALHVSQDGPVLVAVDEMQRFSDQYGSIDGITAILEEGGMCGVSFIGNSHRPTDIQIAPLASADRIVVFQTTHSSDIKRLQHYIDVDDDVFIGLSAPDDENPTKVSEYLEWRTSWGRRFEIKTFNEAAAEDAIRRVPDNPGGPQRRVRDPDGAEGGGAAGDSGDSETGAED